jgi:hypothetical protein
MTVLAWICAVPSPGK